MQNQFYTPTGARVSGRAETTPPELAELALNPLRFVDDPVVGNLGRGSLPTGWQFGHETPCRGALALSPGTFRLTGPNNDELPIRVVHQSCKFNINRIGNSVVDQLLYFSEESPRGRTIFSSLSPDGVALERRGICSRAAADFIAGFDVNHDSVPDIIGFFVDRTQSAMERLIAAGTGELQVREQYLLPLNLDFNPRPIRMVGRLGDRARELAIVHIRNQTSPAQFALVDPHSLQIRPVSVDVQHPIWANVENLTLVRPTHTGARFAVGFDENDLPGGIILFDLDMSGNVSNYHIVRAPMDATPQPARLLCGSSLIAWPVNAHDSRVAALCRRRPGGPSSTFIYRVGETGAPVFETSLNGPITPDRSWLLPPVGHCGDVTLRSVIQLVDTPLAPPNELERVRLTAWLLSEGTPPQQLFESPNVGGSDATYIQLLDAPETEQLVLMTGPTLRPPHIDRLQIFRARPGEPRSVLREVVRRDRESEFLQFVTP